MVRQHSVSDDNRVEEPIAAYASPSFSAISRTRLP
jgi:hypothetical protein